MLIILLGAAAGFITLKMHGGFCFFNGIIDYMGCLETFHRIKNIVIDLEIREHFNIPKVHAILHYVNCMQSLGSVDGYNTESPERLHIDFAKEAYHATNKRDYVEQIAVWLQRHEAIWLQESYNHI